MNVGLTIQNSTGPTKNLDSRLGNLWSRRIYWSIITLVRSAVHPPGNEAGGEDE